MIQEFEVENADENKAQRTLGQQQQEMEPLVRSEGAYSCPTNPWPRDLAAEERDMAPLVQKQKIPSKRQGPGNCWDQYGGSSSATSSEACIMSEKANVNLNWGPWSS